MTFGVGRPSTSVTRTFPGFRSRWMIPFWWACWTAWQTDTNSSSRAFTVSRCLVAVVGERHPLHQLHDEERLSGRGEAAVVDAGDVGVVHQRQGLPLGVEPGQHAPRIHPGLDQLERHLPLDRFGLAGQIDRAHAALADHLDQRVPAGDDGADPFARRDPRRAGRGGRRFRGRGGIGIGAGERLRRPVGPVLSGRDWSRQVGGRRGTSRRDGGPVEFVPLWA